MASTQKKRKSCSWLLGWFLLFYMHDARTLYMLHIKRPAAIVDRGAKKHKLDRSASRTSGNLLHVLYIENGRDKFHFVRCQTLLIQSAAFYKSKKGGKTSFKA
jgi:hypothetical protein